MSERKNIDKLFQEKFKDFEVDPPENTWPELERRLKKKKDRKVIPFWWRLSGVAAALVIGLLIGNGLGIFGGGNQDQNQEVNGVVIQENNANGNAVSPGTDTNPNLKSNDALVAPTDSSESTSVAETSGDGRLEGNSGNGNPANPNAKVKFKDYQKANPKDAVAGTNAVPESGQATDRKASGKTYRNKRGQK